MDATRPLALFLTAMLCGALTNATWGQSTSQLPFGSDPNRTFGQKDAAVDSQVPTQITKKPDFGIPFELASDAYDINEVRLYVSADQGRDWKLFQRRRTNEEEFQFQAPADGEYWFAVRTADSRGRLTSQDPLQAELKVLVDTQLPRLDLRVNVNSSGRAIAEWLAQDAHLLGSTFRLQYQDRNGQWNPVRVMTLSESDRRQQWEGRAEWQVSPLADQVVVVGEIFDGAENVARVHKRVAVRQTVTGNRPRYDDPNSIGTKRIGLTNRGAERAPVAANYKNPEISRRSILARPAHAESRAPMKTNRGRGSVVGENWGHMTKGVRDWFAGVKHTENPHGEAQTRSVPKPPAGDANSLTQSPVYGPVADRNPQGFAGFNGGQETGRRPNRPRITSSPNFEIDYDLQGVGEEGARLVELWFSRDDGHTWELYGADADRQSPMEVRLKSEGMYGFRLVVHGYDAPAPRPPQDSEPADIWVAADWTKPVGRITRAYLTNGQSGQTASQRANPLSGQARRELLIEWVAEDALLDDQPITLSFSDSADGPWTPIASALHNSGSYHWRIDRQLPPKVYLQLEIRDMAGGVTTTVYDKALSSQFEAPSGQIRGIRPLRRNALRSMNIRY